MATDSKDMEYLKELTEYKIAAEYSDIRGWEVADAENRTIGKVSDLLVNKQDERAVYMDILVGENVLEWDRNALESEGVQAFVRDNHDHLIVPLGMAELDEQRRKITTRQIKYRSFVRSPQR